LCILRAWDGKTIGTGRERKELYELELISDQVTCISTFSALDYHWPLGHPSLFTLNFFLI